jgi:hypothetical protein
VLLYSTNTQLKFRISRDFLGGNHYCWCSPVFSAKNVARYARGASTPPSSDPCSIYKELSSAVQRGDEHCDKIKSQKANLTALAAKMHADGKVSSDARDEILEMIRRASFFDWTPYLFVIPNNGLGIRLQQVPRHLRASHEMEYIVADLKESEFDILEFPS